MLGWPCLLNPREQSWQGQGHCAERPCLRLVLDFPPEIQGVLSLLHEEVKRKTCKRSPVCPQLNDTDDHYTIVASQFVWIEESGRLPFKEALDKLYTVVITIDEKRNFYIASLGKYGQIKLFEIVRAWLSLLYNHRIRKRRVHRQARKRLTVPRIRALSKERK